MRQQQTDRQKNTSGKPAQPPSPQKEEKDEIGEGNRSAARRYNEGLKQTLESKDVEALADEAKKALEGPEGEALKQAEEQAKRGPKTSKR